MQIHNVDIISHLEWFVDITWCARDLVTFYERYLEVDAFFDQYFYKYDY